MTFARNSIINRLFVAGAIALGGSVYFAQTPLSNAAGNSSSVSTQLTAPGTLNFARVSTILTANIVSTLCPGGQILVRTDKPPFIDDLTAITATPKYQINPIKCGLNTAAAVATINSTLAVRQPNQNIFTGSLNVNVSLQRPPLGRSSVFASSRSQLALQTTVAPQINVSGRYNDARTAYTNDADPNNFSSTNTTISYFIRQDQPLAIARQSTPTANAISTLTSGFFFRTQSNLDGVFNWDDTAIDFRRVRNGTFLIEWGDVVGRNGLLSLELKDGCLVRSIDTEDFEGWLPQIGSCSPIILQSSLPNFGFDFEYDLGTFDRSVEFGLGIGTNSVVAPEPITIIGTFASFGFGWLFKRRYGKRTR